MIALACSGNFSMILFLYLSLHHAKSLTRMSLIFKLTVHLGLSQYFLYPPNQILVARMFAHLVRDLDCRFTIGRGQFDDNVHGR